MFLSLTILCLSLTPSLSLSHSPSWTTAVNQYVSSMSWSKLLINLIDPNLNDMMEKAKQGESQGLDSDADWLKAVEKSLLRQSHFNTIINEILKAVTRIIGWTFLSLGLYAL